MYDCNQYRAGHGKWYDGVDVMADKNDGVDIMADKNEHLIVS